MSTASGNTTVAMSRPSITPPPVAWAQRRWRATSSARTALLAATADTLAFTSGERIAAVTSVPSTCTVGPSMTSTIALASSATAAESWGSTPLVSAR